MQVDEHQYHGQFLRMTNFEFTCCKSRNLVQRSLLQHIQKRDEALAPSRIFADLLTDGGQLHNVDLSACLFSISHSFILVLKILLTRFQPQMIKICKLKICE